jgi:anti-sigma B factor antagonist
MEVKEQLIGDVGVISIEGNLKGGQEVMLLHSTIKKCLDDKLEKIVVNLKGVEWMGSVGIGILICCLTAVKNAGGDLRLCSLSNKVQDLLRITKLERIFDVYPDTQKAVESYVVH